MVSARTWFRFSALCGANFFVESDGELCDFAVRLNFVCMLVQDGLGLFRSRWKVARNWGCACRCGLPLLCLLSGAVVSVGSIVMDARRRASATSFVGTDRDGWQREGVGPTLNRDPTRVSVVRDSLRGRLFARSPRSRHSDASRGRRLARVWRRR